MNEKTTPVHDEDCLDIETLNFSTESMNTLNEEDQDFIKLNKAVALARSINALDMKIVYSCRLIREFFPEADIETIKLICSRIDDIETKAVDELNMGFIDSILTVGDKKYDMALPSAMDRKFGAKLKELSKIDYYRTIIGCLKGVSDELDSAAKKKDEFSAAFEKEVDEKHKEIIASPDKIEEYTISYFKKKLENPETDEVTKRNIEETLKWMNYAYNLEPIITTVRGILQEKGTTSSIIYGYKHRASGIFKAAMQTCEKQQITFPVNTLIGIESYLLGEEYKSTDHLFAYLIAWYIKYRSSGMNRYEKIFITQLLSIVSEISQHKKDPDDKNPTKEIKEKFSPFLKQLIDLVLDNCN